MTDNEIIKALECCTSDWSPCMADCKYDADVVNSQECMENLMRDALALINRQKAEIERLRGPNRAYPFCNLIGGCLVFSKSLKDYNDMRKGIESEARKEFADRVKGLLSLNVRVSNEDYLEITEDIENLLEEMEERV